MSKLLFPKRGKSIQSPVFAIRIGIVATSGNSHILYLVLFKGGYNHGVMLDVRFRVHASCATFPMS